MEDTDVVIFMGMRTPFSPFGGVMKNMLSQNNFSNSLSWLKLFQPFLIAPQHTLYNFSTSVLARPMVTVRKRLVSTISLVADWPIADFNTEG